MGSVVQEQETRLESLTESSTESDAKIAKLQSQLTKFEEANQALTQQLVKMADDSLVGLKMPKADTSVTSGATKEQNAVTDDMLALAVGNDSAPSTRPASKQVHMVVVRLVAKSHSARNLRLLSTYVVQT